MINIDSLAFSGCKSLESIVFPTGLKTIGRRAFSGCGLKEVHLPNSLERIEWEAFSNCDDLNDVYLPESISFFGAFLFNGCSNLTIHGVAGSSAEQYAHEQGLPFVAEENLKL